MEVVEDQLCVNNWRQETMGCFERGVSQRQQSPFKWAFDYSCTNTEQQHQQNTAFMGLRILQRQKKINQTTTTYINTNCNQYSEGQVCDPASEGSDLDYGGHEDSPGKMQFTLEYYSWMGRIFLNEENLHLHSLCKEFRESQAGSTTEIKYEAQCGWREGN